MISRKLTLEHANSQNGLADARSLRSDVCRYAGCRVGGRQRWGSHHTLCSGRAELPRGMLPPQCALQLWIMPGLVVEKSTTIESDTGRLRRFVHSVRTLRSTNLALFGYCR